MNERTGATQDQARQWASPDVVGRSLADAGYLADERICSVVHLGDRLGKPVLVEGPAGTGKTELAKSVAAVTGRRLIRLQCYEGLDEAKALYEWNYSKQLLRIQAERAGRARRADWAELQADIFSEEFLLARPLLAAIRAPDPVVLLIDEVDRLDVETEALLLEVLSDYQVSIPELGTVTSTQTPLVFLTSNNSRDLSEALKRRCLYLYIDYPAPEREQAIVLSRVPGLSAALAGQITRVVRSLRQLELKKRPSVSETIDWARTLSLLGAEEVSTELVIDTLHVLLKHQPDIEKATAEFQACPLTWRLRSGSRGAAGARIRLLRRAQLAAAGLAGPAGRGGRETIAVDLLGHGRAPRPASPAGYEAVEAHVAAAIGDREPVDAIGFSAGAQVLLRLAADQPGRFRRLALLGIGARALERGDPEPIIAALEDDPDPENVHGMVFRRLAEGPGNDRAALIAFLRRPQRPLSAADLARITGPVLVVLGDQDPAGPGRRPGRRATRRAAGHAARRRSFRHPVRRPVHAGRAGLPGLLS